MIYFNWRIITLQYCDCFLPNISMNQSWVYMCPPVLNSPCHLPPHPIPLGCPRAPALGALLHALVVYFTYGNIHVSMLFSQIIPLMYTWIFEKYPWGKSPCTMPTPLKVLTLTQRWEFTTGYKNNIPCNNINQFK